MSKPSGEEGIQEMSTFLIDRYGIHKGKTYSQYSQTGKAGGLNLRAVYHAEGISKRGRGVSEQERNITVWGVLP